MHHYLVSMDYAEKLERILYPECKQMNVKQDEVKKTDGSNSNT